MRGLTDAILKLVEEGLPLGDPPLERAIKVASVLQGLRIQWIDSDRYVRETPTGKVHLLEYEEIRAVVEGRMFPTDEIMEILVQFFDSRVKKTDNPIPKTKEVQALYAWIKGELGVYDNPLAVNCGDCLTTGKIHKDPKKENIAYLAKKQEANRIRDILDREGVITSTEFRKLIPVEKKTG